MTIINFIITACWAAFILIWAVSALWAKKDIRGGGVWGSASRFLFARLIVLALAAFVISRVLSGSARRSTGDIFIAQAVFHPALWLAWLGAVLVFLGISFAVWARFHLGRNWSGVPSVKQDHELVTSGPYAFVRHPIYTGMLAAALGTALTGSVFGLGVLVVGAVVFLSRIGREERIMLELFPREYPEYKRRTWALVPHVW